MKSNFRRFFIGLLTLGMFVYSLPIHNITAAIQSNFKNYSLVAEDSDKSSNYTIDSTGKIYIKFQAKTNAQLNLNCTSTKKLSVVLLDSDKEKVTKNISSKTDLVNDKTVYGVSSFYYIEKGTYYFLISGKANQKINFRCNYKDISEYKIYSGDDFEINLKMNSSNKYLLPAGFGSTIAMLFQFKISKAPEYLYLDATNQGECSITLSKVGSKGNIVSYKNCNNQIGNLFGERNLIDYSTQFFVDSDGNFVNCSKGTYIVEFELSELSSGAIISLEFFNYYPY